MQVTRLEDLSGTSHLTRCDFLLYRPCRGDFKSPRHYTSMPATKTLKGRTLTKRPAQRDGKENMLPQPQRDCIYLTSCSFLLCRPFRAKFFVHFLISDCIRSYFGLHPKLLKLCHFVAIFLGNPLSFQEDAFRLSDGVISNHAVTITDNIYLL